nr:MAG: hypothetical protein [Grapevine umbra-like virus 3]WRQ19788.1 MAG: hypothetical protein [Grapevine umbra-like virus 3]
MEEIKDLQAKIDKLHAEKEEKRNALSVGRTILSTVGHVGDSALGAAGGVAGGALFGAGSGLATGIGSGLTGLTSGPVVFAFDKTDKSTSVTCRVRKSREEVIPIPGTDEFTDGNHKFKPEKDGWFYSIT